MQNKLCSKGEDKSISIEYFLGVVIQTPFLFMDDFIIFEPSTSYKVIPKKPPQISVSGLVLLDIRLNSRMTFEQIYQVICSEKVDNKFNKLHIAVKSLQNTLMLYKRIKN